MLYNLYTDDLNYLLNRKNQGYQVANRCVYNPCDAENPKNFFSIDVEKDDATNSYVKECQDLGHVVSAAYTDDADVAKQT